MIVDLTCSESAGAGVLLEPNMAILERIGRMMDEKQMIRRNNQYRVDGLKRILCDEAGVAGARELASYPLLRHRTVRNRHHIWHLRNSN